MAEYDDAKSRLGEALIDRLPQAASHAQSKLVKPDFEAVLLKFGHMRLHKAFLVFGRMAKESVPLEFLGSLHLSVPLDDCVNGGSVCPSGPTLPHSTRI